mmetsp:Transcript_9701/g.21876  ORF Transcript_9701/g.21876 Transcript_9701/m.21876 type:complete len:323 (-) Transcript_9701:217-1185(-)
MSLGLLPSKLSTCFNNTMLSFSLSSRTVRIEVPVSNTRDSHGLGHTPPISHRTSTSLLLSDDLMVFAEIIATSNLLYHDLDAASSIRGELPPAFLDFGNGVSHFIEGSSFHEPALPVSSLYRIWLIDDCKASPTLFAISSPNAFSSSNRLYSISSLISDLTFCNSNARSSSSWTYSSSLTELPPKNLVPTTFSPSSSKASSSSKNLTSLSLDDGSLTFCNSNARSSSSWTYSSSLTELPPKNLVPTIFSPSSSKASSSSKNLTSLSLDDGSLLFSSSLDMCSEMHDARGDTMDGEILHGCAFLFSSRFAAIVEAAVRNVPAV